MAEFKNITIHNRKPRQIFFDAIQGGVIYPCCIELRDDECVSYDSVLGFILSLPHNRVLTRADGSAP